ncbi:MAG: sodium:solute symporter [marine bacterium B5-7]|nr:MAG: sodium:solute symporter [marine bacterium B5-7]
MLTTNFVLITALLYVVLLFVLAYFSDRQARRGRDALLRSPLIYTLSISVYCTSWTFYGAVGSAARNGLEFATIYLGPTLVFVGWWFLLRKLVRIGHVHRITSIADLISSRFGKSTTLAVLVTTIAVMGTTPYIALQLKAVTTSFQVVSNVTHTALLGAPLQTGDTTVGFWVAAAMAVFTILFGTRNLDANEHNPGVVAAIAFEALVKLFALIAVGLFVVFKIAGGFSEVFDFPAAAEMLQQPDDFGARWITLTLLSGIAIVCLPRQFQITVVENSDEKHLRTASWAFPVYLLLTSLFILPIALTGLATLPVGSNPDMFVLTLPMSADNDVLALFAFIGGFSSATSMVIVASIALSIMVSNQIVVPLAIRLPFFSLQASGDIKQLLLVSRRISIAVILFLGYLYFSYSARSDALAAIGLIAFAGVAQFSPALIGGLFWRNATSTGAICGLLGGFVIWIYTLFLPSLAGGVFLSSFIEHGPFGIALLKPYALFGLEGLDPLIHSLYFSLGINIALFLVCSNWSEQKPLERLQSALFVDVFRNVAGTESRVLQRRAATKDLYILAQRILGPAQTHQLFNELTGGHTSLESLPPPDAHFIAQIERRLAGNIGASTARALVSQIATGEVISLDEIIKLVDETQQVVEYSHRLEDKSRQLQQTAEELRRANESLQQLDAMKDEFLSQVSHEVRTPMTSIRSFAEVLIDSEDLSSELTRRFLGIIHEESLRLTRLLDEILELSNLERGELRINCQPSPVGPVIDRAIRICQGIARQENVKLTTSNIHGDAIILQDSDRLQQVIINLVTNAIKYNTNQDPEVEVFGKVSSRNFELYIRDNGSGIADGERVFEKFTRGRSQAVRGKPGSGLGLPISHQIIIRMGGGLELVENDESGTCFRIRLPLSI